MRQNEKEQLLELLKTLGEAHMVIKDYLSNDDFSNAYVLLADCQQTAVGIGEFIETIEGEDCICVRRLEDYCEGLYQISEGISEGLSLQQAEQMLDESLAQIENSVEQDIAVRLEVVFLPYKASMWDSLESVWKAADEDPACDAYVIPIPYYDRNPDRSFGQEHYEGDLYPDYVPITHYEEYDFKIRKPDTIYIHNPYDDCNLVTSVHPAFYSRVLKNYTKNLVYIPYFILGEINPQNHEAIKNIEHFCTVPGVFHSNKIIVQSEEMRQIYVDVLAKAAGEQTRKIWEEKIEGSGSPKIIKVLNMRKEDLVLPEEWRSVIMKADGSWKKIIFYNTSVASLLQHETKMLKKMQSVFTVFKKHQDEVALLWRPHPLIMATIEAMMPWLQEEYRGIVENYRAEAWGIYDETSDMDRAVIICDGYYGDESSIVQLCKKVGKPIMIQNVEAVSI